jgi:hypothetical protein
VLLDDLVSLLHSKAKDVKSLRIKIDKEDVISNEALQSLLTISFDVPNITIDKKMKTEAATPISETQRKELEERKKEISHYAQLSFEDITIQYAKNKYNANITIEDINRALS